MKAKINRNWPIKIKSIVVSVLAMALWKGFVITKLKNFGGKLKVYHEGKLLFGVCWKATYIHNEIGQA